MIFVLVVVAGWNDTRQGADKGAVTKAAMQLQCLQEQPDLAGVINAVLAFGVESMPWGKKMLQGGSSIAADKRTLVGWEPLTPPTHTHKHTHSPRQKQTN